MIKQPVVNASQNSALFEKLQRLESYLKQDPQNLSLLGDVFDVALASGEFARAETYLKQGQAIEPSSSIWKFREATLHIAKKNLDEAWDILQELQLEIGSSPALIHNLAYIVFCRQRYTECCELLRPLVDADVHSIDSSVQVLWLRTLHRLTLIDEALTWCEPLIAAGTLAPAAAGVASLICIDAAQFERAQKLSEQALKQEPQQMEALVARATVALAQRDTASAKNLLGRALQQNAQDGRTWSGLGFAELLDLKIDQAFENFKKSVTFMPDHIGTWHGLAWTCIMRKDTAGARQAFETALSLDRNFGESHGGLAVVQAMTGERANARASIDRALGLDKANLSARYAETILSGEASDAQAVQRLARRLLGGRKAIFGDGTMADWLPPSDQ
jgi:tetratricopeptide (TPR) repeat protein